MSEQLPGEALKPCELEVLQLMAAGLSNEEIAAQLFVEVTTVRWHNRQLYGKLGVHSRTLAVARARELGLLADGNTAPAKAEFRTAPGGKTNLPAPVSSFVGREREIAKVMQLLAKARLLTLTGPGGTGKTRLALAVAGEVAGLYRDGVWFVPLAAVQDEGLVASAMAGALGAAESAAESLEASVVKHLQGKQMLVVVDNFEHLMGAARLLAAVLEGTAEAKLLVTSREVLRLSGEQEYPVPPLTVPELDETFSGKAAASLATTSEAERLFVERAQATQPAFVLTPENLAAVSRICVQLDGLPLAIELAAARAKLLPPPQLLARLQRGLSGLGQGPRDAPARQRTLEATIGWSYQLLGEDERRLFGRLGVFRGGWTLEAMAAVCGEGEEQDSLELLSSLVDKSLVQPVEGGREVRFRMLETIREYAWRQLAPEEAVTTQRRHRDWFLQLAEEGREGIRTAEAEAWYARLQPEEDNFDAALAWCLEQPEEAQAGLRMSDALMRHWHGRGMFREARYWLRSFLERTGGLATVVRARALNSAGVLAYRQGDYGEVAGLCRAALSLSEALGEKDAVAQALHYLAHIAQIEQRFDEAEAMLTRSIDLSLEEGSILAYAESRNCLGDLHRQQGRYAEAEQMLAEALAVRRDLGHRRLVAGSLVNLGHVMCRQLDAAGAAACFGESLAISQALHDRRLISVCIAGSAGVVVLKGQYVVAAGLVGAADRLLAEIGYALEPADRGDYDWIVEQARAGLGEAAYQSAWAEGQRMSLDLAVAYARMALVD